MKKKQKKNSWEEVSQWYLTLVKNKGHYYHRHIIFPNLSKMLPKTGSLLDLACGQGALIHILGKKIDYWGIDLSPSLIRQAKKLSRHKNHHFIVGDIEKKLVMDKNDFDCVTVILSLQDIQNYHSAINNAAGHLKKDGKLIIVLNHPCFRIPRQSSWEINQKEKKQMRKIASYMSELSIPIQVNPSKKNQSKTVINYHRPLYAYFHALKQAGFYIEDIDEWVSDKKSTGKYASMENKARKEIPLFLTIIALKKKKIKMDYFFL